MSSQQSVMFRLVLAALLVVFSSFAATRADASDCSCTAPDSSCSTSISCGNGCSAVCASGGQCSSSCSRGPLHQEPFRFDPTVEEGDLFFAPQLDSFFALNLDSAGPEEVSRGLSQTFASPVTFVPGPNFEQVSVQVEGYPGRELLESLSRGGNMILVAGGEGAGRASQRAALQEVLFFESEAVAPEAILGRLESELGVSLRFEPNEPLDEIALQVKGATVLEVLQLLARLGSLEVNGSVIAPAR